MEVRLRQPNTSAFRHASEAKVNTRQRTPGPRTIAKAHALALLTIVVASGYRLATLSEHFTHIDDIGVAVTLLDARKPDYVVNRLLDAQAVTFDSPPKQWLRRKLNDPSTGPALHKALNTLGPWVAVPMSWTYAPLQFPLTQVLLPSSPSYRQTLFWGRFPSWLASVAAMAAFWWVLSYLGLASGFGLLALSLFCFSQENFILAQQMYNYALGILGSVLIVLMAAQLSEGSGLGASARRRVLLGCGLSLLVYAQYQALFLGTALLLSAFASDCFRARGSRGAVRNLVLSGLPFGVLSLPAVVYLKVKGFSGVAWNAGPNGEFLFAWSDLPSAITFFVRNGFVTGTRLLAFFPEPGPGAQLGLCVIGSLGAFGVLECATSAAPRIRAIGGYIAATGLVFLALILAGAVTLGPTRHSAVLIPLAALMVALGARRCARIVVRATGCADRTLDLASSLGAILAGCLFAAQFGEFAEARKDPFEEHSLSSLLAHHGVQRVIGYGNTLNPALMPALSFASVSLDSNLSQDAIAHIAQSGEVVALVGARNPPQLAAPDLLHALTSTRSASFSESRQLSTHIEYSALTESGANGLYVVVLSPRPTKPPRP